MMTRLGSPWLKANDTRPEDWCDNDFEPDNSWELITISTSDDNTAVNTAKEATTDDEDERANLAEVYGRSPSPK